MAKPRYRVAARSVLVADVHKLDVEPLMNDDIAPRAILDAAAGETLISVIVAGQNDEGEFCYWSSCARNGDALMLVERARDMTLKCERDSGWRPVSGGGDVVPLRRRS